MKTYTSRNGNIYTLKQAAKICLADCLDLNGSKETFVDHGIEEVRETFPGESDKDCFEIASEALKQLDRVISNLRKEVFEI